jgi:hypothetical protein
MTDKTTSETPRIDRGDAVNLVHSMNSAEGVKAAAKGVLILADAVTRMDEGIRTLERRCADLTRHRSRRRPAYIKERDEALRSAASKGTNHA